ncbi:MAG: site-2 protease family protein [Planctomycetaceae bacterium]
MDGWLTAHAAPLVGTAWLEWFAQPANWWVVLQVACGLGFVIFVHELGHFLVAKACGVKCEKFFLGFDVGGLKLASFKAGETEYGIGILPLGGYVKMLGQDDNPAAAASEAQRARMAGDLPAEPVDAPHPAWDPRSYPAQSVPKRMAIISAGVIMNVIFAVLMAALAYGIGVREMTSAVSSVRTGGAAWRAGLRTGDEIVAIAGRRNPIFNDLRHGVTVGSVAKGIEFTVKRPGDDTERTVVLKPDTDLGAPTIGVTSPYSLTLPADISRGLVGAAARAEPALAGGDTIRAIDGVPVESYAELLARLSATADKAVTLTVDRSSAADSGGTRSVTSVSVTVPPQPRLATGLVMTPLAIKAVQDGSPAAAAGVQSGERLTAIDGEPVGDPFTLDDRLRGRAGSPVTLTLAAAGGAERTVTVTPRVVTWRDDESAGVGSPLSIAALGLALPVDAVAAAVEPGSAAARVGLQAGDRITGAVLVEPGTKPDARDGIEFSPREPNWPVVAAVLQQLPAGTSLQFTVEPAGGGDAREVTVTPEPAAGFFVADRGLVFDPIYKQVKAGSFAGAIRRGLQKTREDLSMVYGFLGKLTKREISPRLLGGPIEIAKQAGRHASEGFGRFLLFLTMLSANLAVVNFLPIPVLDGGHMVFLLYEFLRGKPPSEGVVVTLSYLGLALILSLMFFVFGLDLGLIPRR